jgi:hypothetical protein
MTEKEFFETKAKNLVRLFQITYDSQEEKDARVFLMQFNLKEIVKEHKELQQYIRKRVSRKKYRMPKRV